MLHFDFEGKDFYAVANELGASERQFQQALNRACVRTATTLRKQSSKGLKNELQLRTVGLLRRRLKDIKMRSGKVGITLWYGLNDMPVSSFKGRAQKTAGGAQFGEHQFDGAFVAKSRIKNKRTIFKRKGTARLPIIEQLLPIKDQADVFIEDEIFVNAEEIFWQHFRRDLQARVKYDLGWKG